MDWSVIVVGAFTLAGTIVTVVVGNSSTRKLILYRIEQLEKKVEKHNNLVERMTLAEEKIKVANHRIEDLEKVVGA